MLTPQFLLPIADELIVDLFAGSGGASTGIEQAIGRHVDIAINHDPEAVSLHQANHPQTLHFVSDVFEVDPVTVAAGRPIGLLWASPDCTFHSKARGGKPFRERGQANKRRALAGVVVRWAKAVRPRVIFLENVEEFQRWGPLDSTGRPCERRAGSSFRRWVSSLRNCGYTVEWRELRACDYGAPTIRKRLFLIARCDGAPIVWPAPTHGAGRTPYRTAASIIDWSIPCPSIFERSRPLAEATMRRIAHGIRRYVLDSPNPFVVRIGHTGYGDAGKVRSVDAPLSTVTTKAEHLLVSPSLVVNTSGHPGAAADQPVRTITTGGHHALVAAFLAKHYGDRGQRPGSEMREPVSTVTAVDHHSLVTAQIVGCGGRAGQSRPRNADEPLATLTAKADSVLVTSHLAKLRGTSNSVSTDEPLHTVSAGGQHHAEVRAMLVKYYGNDRDGQGLREPLHTVPTRDRFGLVTVDGTDYEIADIGMRMLQPRELYSAQGFPADYIIDRGADGRPLTKTAQVRMCGNSVCPPIAAALVRANFSDALRAAA